MPSRYDPPVEMTAAPPSREHLPSERWTWAALALTPLLPLLAAVPVAGRWALPAAAPLAVYPAFAARVRRCDHLGAWQVAIAWAVLLSAGVIALVQLWPEAAASGILHGEAYRQEMFGWIATGRAPENDWRQFLPVHLTHLALFLVLTAASGGYLGLVLGAALVDYMSYFVGAYALVSEHPLAGALAAWVPWSVVRVFSFVLLGALFARPVLARRLQPFGRREARLLAVAAAGLATDVLVKAALAPSYGLWLRHLAHGVIAFGGLYSGAFGRIG